MPINIYKAKNVDLERILYDKNKKIKPNLKKGL
jgi:hypothetical protein